MQTDTCKNSQNVGFKYYQKRNYQNFFFIRELQKKSVTVAGIINIDGRYKLAMMAEF